MAGDKVAELRVCTNDGYIYLFTIKNDELKNSKYEVTATGMIITREDGSLLGQYVYSGGGIFLGVDTVSNKTTVNYMFSIGSKGSLRTYYNTRSTVDFYIVEKTPNTNGDSSFVWTGAVAKYKGDIIALIPEGKTATFHTTDRGMEGDLEIITGTGERGLDGPIAFKIQITTYDTATMGMTWGEWVDQYGKYDNFDILESGEVIRRNTDGSGSYLTVCLHNGATVYAYEAIIPGYSYDYYA